MALKPPSRGIIGASLAELRATTAAAGNDGASGPSEGVAACLGILSPVTAGLDPHLATMACALPVGDANTELLQAAEGDEVPAGVLAGVLAHDPFRRRDQLLRALSGHGFCAIINWPSVAVLDGELAAALEHSGFTYALELELLCDAAKAGLQTAALVHSEAQMKAAVNQQPDMLVLTPGLASRDPGKDREHAAEFVTLVTEARQATTADLAIHLPPAFVELLRDQLPADIGVIRHRSAEAGTPPG